MMIGIVAIAKNFAIGKDGKLPWHHSADLKFFKETTMGHAIVMGSATWRSIGKPLPGRLNIVLTRRTDLDAPDSVVRLGSAADVMDLAKTAGHDVFIIGGAKTFEAFADVIARWIVTTVPDRVEGADTFMPKDFLDGFEGQKTIELGEGLDVKVLDRKK